MKTWNEAFERIHQLHYHVNTIDLANEYRECWLVTDLEEDFDASFEMSKEMVPSGIVEVAEDSDGYIFIYTLANGDVEELTESNDFDGAMDPALDKLYKYHPWLAHCELKEYLT